MINKVEIANVNTSKLQVLTSDETKELFKLMKNGDKDAREKYRDLAINNETSVAKAKQKIIDDLRKLQEKKDF